MQDYYINKRVCALIHIEYNSILEGVVNLDFNLKVGMTAEVGLKVSDKDTAVSFGSGEVSVFATPMMIALMEKASLTAVDPHLDKGYATVGLTVNVKHMAATPVGMEVTARAELLNIEGKKLTFKIEAFDEVEKIGEGTHERYIIELAKFLDRTGKKGSVQ